MELHRILRDRSQRVPHKGFYRRYANGSALACFGQYARSEKRHLLNLFTAHLHIGEAMLEDLVEFPPMRSR